MSELLARQEKYNVKFDGILMFLPASPDALQWSYVAGHLDLGKKVDLVIE
jgi:hypothetical protein